MEASFLALHRCDVLDNGRGVDFIQSIQVKQCERTCECTEEICNWNTRVCSEATFVGLHFDQQVECRFTNFWCQATQDT